MKEGTFDNNSQNQQFKFFQDIQPINYQSDLDIITLDCFMPIYQYPRMNQITQTKQQEKDRLKIINEQELDSLQSTQNKVGCKKQKTKITSNTRLSNYVFPNIVRQVKHCLSNSFQAQSKRIFKLLMSIFRQLNMKYQVWAFDAIFVILIFLRDKTDLLTPKKFHAVIDHITSTLEKYQAKFLSKSYNQDQINYLKNQYNHCLNHIKFYDDPMNDFDTLFQQKVHQIREQFFASVLLSRRRQRFKFIEQVNKVGKFLTSTHISSLILTKIKTLNKQHKKDQGNQKKKQSQNEEE